METKRYPILEFDPDQKAYIEPSMNKTKAGCTKLVITFFKEVIDHLISSGIIEPFLQLKGENSYTFYRFKDTDIMIFHGGIGGPLCGGMMEEAIASGVRKIMFCGGGGVLQPLPVGTLIVVDSAIRDEGLSYHYAEPSREIFTNRSVLDTIQSYLNQNQIPYTTGKAWTTDAFYRETAGKVALRKQEGACIVEMEQASLIAVAQFRNVSYGAILYGGDDLSSDVWDSRKWKDRQSIRTTLVDICTEIVNRID